MHIQDYLTLYNYNSLNKQQKEALSTVEGPVLLLAVPGSGKTTVLVARAGFMVFGCGIPGKNILALTFSSAAAKEMKERYIAKFDANETQTPMFSTIHSFCVKVIRYTNRYKGEEVPQLQPNNEIPIRDVYISLTGEYPLEATVKALQTEVGFVKNKMLSPKDYAGKDIEGVNLGKFYKMYIKHMQTKNWMDFDDQLIFAYKFLQQYPDVLTAFQDQFRYLCIDESQDTSLIQHKIIEMLAAKYKNIFMVGDDDQSIYGFRAAHPAALLTFQDRYPNAKILTMGINYRSAKKIVNAADSFIRQNQIRYKKDMFPFSKEEGRVNIEYFGSDEEQYQYLLKTVLKALQGKKTLAVLYRNNDSALPLIDLLWQNSISVRVRDNIGLFFNQWATNDILSVLDYSMDLSNFEKFKKIYYKLRLFIGKTQIAELKSYAEECPDESVFSILNKIVDPKAKNIKERKRVEKIIISLPEMSPRRAINSIVELLEGAYSSSEKTNFEGKANILALIANNYQTCEKFVAGIEVLKTYIPNWTSNVTLSTIHSSKGLEFDSVIMIDINDGVLPTKEAQEDVDLREEETRLFYVGATRAKSELTFLVCRRDCFNAITASEYIQNFVVGAVDNSNSPKIQSGFSASIANRLKKNSTTVSSIDMSKIRAGTRVSHISFGNGIITSMKVNGIAEIVFYNCSRTIDLKLCLENKIITLL